MFSEQRPRPLRNGMLNRESGARRLPASTISHSPEPIETQPAAHRTWMRYRRNVPAGFCTRPLRLFCRHDDIADRIRFAHQYRLGYAPSWLAGGTHFRCQHPGPLPALEGFGRQRRGTQGMGRRYMSFNAFRRQHRRAAAGGARARTGVQPDPGPGMLPAPELPLGQGNGST